MRLEGIESVWRKYHQPSPWLPCHWLRALQHTHSLGYSLSVINDVFDHFV
jgi:hypothetical protein